MLSKKFKSQLKKIAVNTTLAVSAVVVLFVMCVNLGGRVDTTEKRFANAEKEEAKVGNEIAVIKDSTGINLRVSGEDASGINKIEVYQGTNKIKEYTYSGDSQNKTENFVINIPFGETNQVTVMVNGVTVAQKDVQNMRYIFTSQDLVNFRNIVNAGNSFKNQYVELMSNIDLSSVCSSSLGVSWTPIGATGTLFQGTFNGNYYTIANLYINSDAYVDTSLFYRATSTTIIENIRLSNVDIYNRRQVSSGDIRAAGIVGWNNGGTVRNVGIDSGSIRANNMANRSAWGAVTIGGVVGGQSPGNSRVMNCYNRANLRAEAHMSSTNAGAYAGGILSFMNEGGYLINCYNFGNISTSGRLSYAGGLCSQIASNGSTAYITNCYNVGTISASGSDARAAGLLAVNGWSSQYPQGQLTNSYCLNNISYSSWTMGSATNANRVSAATLQGYANTLGANNWVQDVYNINGGYPILRWQAPTLEFDKKQVYTNVGKQIQLNLSTAKYKASQTIGTVNYYTDNADVATVDNNGIVTAVGEGYTTIYANESTYGLKAMMVINVSKSGAVAYSQIESGGWATEYEYTAVLKEDGTVWTFGDNRFGQLGDGTFINSKIPVQVKINKDTPLTNIVKISAGHNHVLALTKDGDLYAWGNNENGQIGINNTENQSYAKRVLNHEGSEPLYSIADISAGHNSSIVMDAGGNVYTWGYNNSGQLGIGNTTDKLLPQITLCSQAIKVQAGLRENAILRPSGTIEVFGENGRGQLGIGGTSNQSLPQPTNTANILYIMALNQRLCIRNTSGTVYNSGINLFGVLGNGTTTDSLTFTAVTLPSSVSANNKVRYIGGGARNTVLLLEDGTLWTVGDNTYGQLSSGTNTSQSTSYVQAKNSDGTYVTNVKNIGKQKDTISSPGSSYQTLSYVGADGFVYTVGDNTFGQKGDGTTTASVYYTKTGAPYLNYIKDDIEIGVEENTTISKNDLRIDGEFNVNIDYTPTPVGTLQFETEDTNISVNSTTGKITGLEEGYARVKVTDTTNGYSTYVTVKVTNGKNTKVELGSKFSVGLTTEGKVWSWGSNTFGELGTNSSKPYEDEPKQIASLSNIKDVAVGYYHAIAVDDNGKVYTWGLNNNGQLGNGNTTNAKEPIEIQGLSNIVKVDAYKYITTAIDENGNLYAWGEGYGNTPKKIYENILDISEDVMITSDRRIMKLDGTLIHNIRNVSKASSYENGILAILDNGQLINIDSTENSTNFDIVNAVEVSCGNGFNYILDKNKKAYAYGANTKGELGNGTNTNTTTLAQISVADVETISAGEGNHGAVTTFDGSIFTTGLNDKGQLGHKNIDDKNVFEMVLNVAIESNVDKVVEQVGESTVVDIGLGMTLNLKKDLTADSTSEITIVDNTIATLTQNGNGTYTVTGNNLGRTFLNATINGTVNGEAKQFATNVEVRIVPEGGITVPQVKSGDGFTVALKSNGKVYTWGNNQYGQLGLGNNDSVDEPKQMASLDETIVEIAVGNNHVIALTENGTIYGWGLNSNGQVGNGTVANQLEQATVINIYGNELNKIIRVEAHGDNSFAINEDGKIFAWGKDFGSRAVELQDVGNAVDVSTSYYVKADGTVYNMSTLQQLELVGHVRVMDEGIDHSVFLTTEGMAYAIGNNSFGQLGNSTNEHSLDRVVAIRKNEQDIFNGIIAIEAGDRYTILLKDDGKVYTCGANENGRLGISDDIHDISTPQVNPNIQDVMLISAGTNHAVVVKTDGEAYSWGRGLTGELGNRTTKNSYIPVMVGPYIIRTDEKNLVLGKTDTKEIKGYVDYFNILNEDIIDINSISKNTQVARITKLANEDSSLTEDEIAKGYKAFRIEAVKEGTTNAVLTEQKTNTNGILQIEVLPEPVTTISPMVESLASFTVTLKTDGTVWSYGQNVYGELGTGDTTSYDEPQKVLFPEGTIIKQIAVGEYHVAALDTEGNIWTWGRNNYYQLGNSNITSSASPVKVTGIPKATRISAGNNSTMAITEDNKLVAWGQNAYGELGIGEYSNKITPTIVEGVHDVLDIQGGKNHYIVLKTTGEIFVTGSNLYGQLGKNIGDRVRTSTFENIESNLKFGSISAGHTSSAAVTVDGVAYVWGQNTFGNLGDGTRLNITTPKQVTGINGVVEADVGKTHTILRDYNGNIYLAGTNANGQLGDGTNTNRFNFDKNLNIEDVLRIDASNTYTAVMKKDGSVWAWGDYNHGSRLLKSRTNSKVPVQIGSDTSSLDNLEMIIKKSEVASILANSQYQFNLIYEDQNTSSDFEYESINTDIASVNENGNVLGIREGSTWVKVKDTKTGKVSIALIRVIDNVEGYTTYTSPKVVAGDNYVANLKEDGSIFVWGYDASKIVDSDVPYSINVVTSYTDLKSGKNHILALRNDGTLWTTGNDDYGQLGVASTNTAGKLIQVQGLTDIEKIAVGNNFSVAMDAFGITYVWGEGFGTTPTVLDTGIRSITALSAGSNDQIVMVLPSGEVYGFGSILNGLLPDFDTAVKVEVGTDYLLILNANGDVYKYQNGTLTKQTGISNIIDISVKDNVNMCQNASEVVYVWGANSDGQLGTGDTNNVNVPTYQIIKENDNAYSIGAGPRNTYIIDTQGHVHASGANDYGQIGNGTKEDTNADSYIQSTKHTIVGSRNFEILPLSSIMEVNDVEELEIKGATYNVFRQESNKNISEYNLQSNNTSIIELLEENSNPTGEIKAVSEGITTIDVTDKITGKTITLTRKVVPMDQNRILSILADGNKAEAVTPSDETTYIFGYTVDVPMDDDETQVSLVIEAKDSNDVISIDDGTTYTLTNKLTQTIQIPTTDTNITIPVTLKSSNGTEFKYELVVNRVSNNNNIDTVTVNSYEATVSASEEDVYEIVITDLGDNQITVTAEDPDALVSIRGKLNTVSTQSLTTTIPKGYLEVPIKITSESGKVKEYTLKIYTPNELLELKQLKVNNTDTIKEDDLNYRKIIADDISRCSIYAEAKYSDSYIGINDAEKDLGNQTKNMITTADETTATVEIQKTVVLDGTEQTISKTYNLKIYKNKVFSLLQEVEVNGEVLEEENNTYVAYVLSNVENAVIKITAKQGTYEIKLDDETESGVLNTTKQLNSNENIYTFTVTGDENNQIVYTLKVIRGETDTTLKKLTVGSGSYVVEAEKTEDILNDCEVYEAKILDTITNVDITAQTANRTSKVDINNLGTFETRIDVENMDLTLKETIIPIIVKTADEATAKTYYLRIIKQEDDVSLSSLSINELLGGADITATLEDQSDDSRYEVNLNNPVKTLEINASANSTVALIKIDENTEETQNTSANITLSSSVTEVPIKVTSEAGTIKTYYLSIHTISDDTSIESVTVNGAQATWNATNNRYEIKVDRNLTGYEVIATATNTNAKMAVNGTENVHQTTKQITNEGDMTIVNLKVTAANDITTAGKKLAIIEKSNNAGLGYVKVNGRAIAADQNGNYKVEVVSTVQSVMIEVGAQDAYASVNVDGTAQTRVWKGTKPLQTDEEIYDVYITAEDGQTTCNQFTITVKRLDGNTKIDSIEVTYNKNGSAKVKTPTVKEDGTYYLKIQRPDEERVNLQVTLQQAISTVNVLGTEGKGSLSGYVNLTGEITRVPIIVTAQDGTTFETTLVLEKESNVTTLKEVKVKDYTVSTNSSGYVITADSNVDKLELTAIPTHDNAMVKLSTSSTYTPTLDGVEVNIAGINEIYIDVLAEDMETTERHLLQVIRTYNTSLESVTVNGDAVNVGTEVNVITNQTANIVITTKNSDAEIYLIKDGTQIATGIGTLTVAQTLLEETFSHYTINVKGPNEYVIYSTDYDLYLRKKATNKNATIFVDGVEISKNEQSGKYEVIVVGPNHEIGAEPESLYAQIQIDGVTGFTKTISVGPKTTTNYIISAIAEDGTSANYEVQIYRKNNDTSIKEVKLKLDETSDEIILIPLADGSYYYKVPRRQSSVFASLETTDANATAVISPAQALNNIMKEVVIDQEAEITNVPLKVIAEDGTEQTVNLKLERESNDTSLKQVKYDGNVITQAQDESYTIEVDNRLTSVNISAIPTNVNAKLKVVGDTEYVSTLSDKNVDITGINSFEIEVLAEDGETIKQYTININRIFSTKVTKIEIDSEEANPSGTNYSGFVDANAENHSIKVVADNEQAVITIYDNEDNELATGTGTVTLTDTFAEESKTYKVKVQGPTGFTEFVSNYTVTVNKKSQDTSAKVFINDVEIGKDENSGKYKLVTKVSNNNVKLVITNDYAKVIINGKPAKIKTAEQVVTVNVGETKTITAKVISQNGEEEVYEIELTRLNNNAKISKIAVNGDNATKITDSLYRNAQQRGITWATVVITAEQEYAQIKASIDGAEYTDISELQFNTYLPGVGTTVVEIVVTAQDGTKQNYTLNIVQNAVDNVNITVKVNSLNPDKLDDSTYRIFVPYTSTAAEVQITAEDEFTTITHESDSGNNITFNKVLETDDNMTIVNFNVSTDTGVSKDCILYIIKESRDNSIEKLYVNGTEITEDENGRYTAYVDNTTGDPTVKVITSNEYAYVRIDNFQEEQHQTEHVTELSETRTTTVPIVVRSQSGERVTKYIDLVATFAVVKIDSVIVDDVEVTDYDESTKTYTALVENYLTEHEIQVIADNNYATLELAEFVGMGSVTSIVDLEGEEFKEYTLYVTSETDALTTYKIVVAEKSNNTNLTQVKVNDVTVPLIEATSQYRKNIDLLTERAKIEVTSEYPFATIKVGDEEIKTKSSGTVWVDLSLEQDEITVPVVVTAADKITIRTYNIVLTRVASSIRGYVETDNWEGKHVAFVTAYRTADKRKIGDPDNPREVIASTISLEDGSYELALPTADTYDLVFTKDGYLTSIITDVVAIPYDNVDAQTIKLKAGDIDGNGEIELDDLVELNDHIGELVTDSNKTYDLNEDGAIDNKDRKLIKANYHSKAQTVKWKNSNNIGLIKPLDDGYLLTSDYGYRVDPIDSSTSFHSGVDLRGPHHGNIYAVADGEVTYAGVQSSYGNCVEIKHIVNGETIYSFYAHMSQIDVQVGDTVTQGQTIGLEGGDPATDQNPGRTTGHHLHFEIRSNSGYTNHVNPHNYLEL